jgi:hypothetical protein
MILWTSLLRNMVKDTIMTPESILIYINNVYAFSLFRRKRIARMPHKKSAQERVMHGLRAKLYHKKRHSEKIEMKKTYVHTYSLE